MCVCGATCKEIKNRNLFSHLQECLIGLLGAQRQGIQKEVRQTRTDPATHQSDASRLVMLWPTMEFGYPTGKHIQKDVEKLLKN